MARKKPAPKLKVPTPGDPEQNETSGDHPNALLHPFRAAEFRRAKRQRRSFASDIEDLERANQVFDLLLKQRVSTLARRAVFAQIIIADLVFAAYLAYNVHHGWRIATAAIDAWLGAVVVQVVGILYIITRYLFPPRGAIIDRTRVDEKHEKSDNDDHRQTSAERPAPISWRARFWAKRR